MVLDVSENAKWIIVSWIEFVEWKGYIEFKEKDLYDILKKYTNLYNNK
jgi:hypothetical protein